MSLVFLLGSSIAMLLRLTVVLVLTGHCWAKEINKYVSILLKNGNEFDVVHKLVDGAIAQGNFTDLYNQTGWNFLEIRTNASFPDRVQAYAAGLAEAALTRELVNMQWLNTVAGYCRWQGREMCQRLRDFISANDQYVKSMVTKYRHTQSYWHQVGLIMEQFEGLNDGVQLNRTTPDDPGLLWLNIAGDLEDLENALRPESELPEHPRLQSFERVLGGGHCSALIKLLDNYTDLYTSQVTWTSYQSMLRIQKRYIFGYHLTSDPKTGIIPGHMSTFSSYPGILGSQDDFYIMSSGLVTQETTIGNNNNQLWKLITADNSVLEWVRSRVANNLADSGSRWAQLFSQHNSGTYNNQWMVVDYKRFKRHAPSEAEAVRPGLLTVLEQLPGLVVHADLTPLLRRQRYWPSYNSPYFPAVFNRSGIAPLVQRFGDWFSYERTPRALIFARNHSRVHDLPSMLQLMRYNNFRRDPLSACANCTPPYSAENAVAARCDLNPAQGHYPFAALGHRNHGATDAKITSDHMMRSMQFHAVAGPTSDNLAPFRWSQSGFVDAVHHGHPDLFQFEPVQWQWQWHQHLH